MSQRKIEVDDGLFDCCTDGGKSCATTICCSAFMPTIAAACRIGWVGIAILLSVLYGLFVIMYSVLSSTPPKSIDQGQLGTALFVIYGSIITLVIVLTCMRISILKRHGRTDVDTCMSCLQAWFCTPCLAAQMMRWTDGRFEKYNNVSKNDVTDIEMKDNEVV